jgi:threonine/homoserine/homoserine lactone efflux protein
LATSTLVLAVIGFEMVREMTLVFSTMKYLGAAYLLFLGVMLLRAPRQPFGSQQNRSFVSAESMARQFLIGFMSAIFNPKNMIFYLSLFTALVSAETEFVTRCLYALWMMSIVFVWDCLVVMTIGRQRVKRWLGRSIFYIEKLSGCALACFGIPLPFT